MIQRMTPLGYARLYNVSENSLTKCTYAKN
jgi:hypothetical protein